MGVGWPPRPQSDGLSRKRGQRGEGGIRESCPVEGRRGGLSRQRPGLELLVRAGAAVGAGYATMPGMAETINRGGGCMTRGWGGEGPGSGRRQRMRLGVGGEGIVAGGETRKRWAWGGRGTRPCVR